MSRVPFEDDTCAAEPIAPETFASALRRVIASSPKGLVVAVSGGPDSVCLMGLLAEWRERTPVPLAVATVDHGLRPEATGEAARVLAQAEAFGLPAHLLRWQGAKPQHAIQEKARDARYALLVALCHERGADHLLTAHHLDDQAETVLFRMARGTGIGGLGGMADRTARDGIVHARPLLAFAKTQLIATCEARGWPYLVDPSNVDPRFARSRIRRLLPALAQEGLDAQAFDRLAARAARADHALAEVAERTAHATRIETGPDHDRFDAARLLREPLELVIRVLAAAVTRIGAGDGPRLDRLERLAVALVDAHVEGGRLGRTLNGTTVTLRDGTLTVTREGPRHRGGRTGALPERSASS